MRSESETIMEKAFLLYNSFYNMICFEKSENVGDCSLNTKRLTYTRQRKGDIEWEHRKQRE